MKTREEIFSFIEKQTVAFIASVDKDGFPNMKAMLVPRKIDESSFYFTTNTSSMRVRQYTNNDKACIYFYSMDSLKYEGVMLIGKMEILTDKETKELIWRSGDTMFYSKGVEDPDYCVLKFTAKKGRHYCNLVTESFEL